MGVAIEVPGVILQAIGSPSADVSGVAPTNAAAYALFIKPAAGRPVFLNSIRYRNQTDTVAAWYKLGLIELSTDGTWTDTTTIVPESPANAGYLAATPGVGVVIKTACTAVPTEVAGTERDTHSCLNSQDWILGSENGLWLKGGTAYALIHRITTAAHRPTIRVRLTEVV